MCVRYVGIITLLASDIKRLVQIASSPMISNVSEVFNGILTIKSFEKTSLIEKKFKTNKQIMMTTELHERYVDNWAFLRVELSTTVIVIFTVFFSVIIKALPIPMFNSVTSLSLAISWSAVIGDLIAFTLATFSNVAKGMNTIERMLEISESKDLEPELEIPKPPVDWPIRAEIQIKNLCMRYRPCLPLVLDRVCLNVESKQKVGIVGRTGSGKSSLILTLLRIIENDNTLLDSDDSDPIVIDGVSINKIGLRYARQAITIIPQDPFVLSGSIRSNIDPYDKYSDDQIIDMLRKTGLIQSLQEIKDRNLNSRESLVIHKSINRLQSQSSGYVSLIDQNADHGVINMEVESGGSNLSQGQRQLLCIARALIKKPKILLMDEATASIDSKTDEVIQQLIRTQFTDSTILTIAHRLNTIIQYDKILSLRDGKVVDYGSPRQLLQDQSTYFCQLVKQNGHEFYKQMLALAIKVDIDKKSPRPAYHR